MPVTRAFLVALGALALGSPLAPAADVMVHATVTRGDLGVTFPPATMQLPAVDLDGGGDRRVYLDLPFTVTDTRGTGSGWSLSVASTGFRQALAPLPGVGASFVGATAACGADDLCTLPRTSVAYPVAIAPDDRPVRFFDADAGSGMGTTDVSARLAVTIPANALAGSFATTLTLTQSVGP
jgi:hypothetical protein